MVDNGAGKKVVEHYEVNVGVPYNEGTTMKQRPTTLDKTITR